MVHEQIKKIAFDTHRTREIIHEHIISTLTTQLPHATCT